MLIVLNNNTACENILACDEREHDGKGRFAEQTSDDDYPSRDS